MLNKLNAFASKVISPPKPKPAPQPQAGQLVKDGFQRAPPTTAQADAKALLGTAATLAKDVLSASRKLLSNDEPMELSEAGEAKYNGLDPAQREQYDDLYEATEGDPAARANLEQLLVSGDLTESKTDTEPPQTLLDVLHETATTEDYQNGYTADEVLSQTLEGIAHPSEDGQDADDKTCPGRSMLHGLATKDPAEYARFLQELARDGEVTRPGADPLELQADPSKDLHHEASRAINASSSPTGTVNENGESELTFTVFGKEVTFNFGSGMKAESFTEELNNNVPDVNYQPAYLDPTASPDSPQTQEAVDLAQESIENGGQVYVKVVDGETAHWLPIDGIDADGNASYIDAEGQTQTVPADELFSDCDAMAIDTNTVDEVPTHYQTPPEGGDTPGTGFPQGSTTQGDAGRKGILQPE